MALDVWLPYLASGFALSIGWLFKQTIQYGKDVVKLQTVVEYYIERQSKDAAKTLNVPNPTPIDMRILLEKHIKGTLNDNERSVLVSWLSELRNDPTADSSEKSAALQLLTGIKTKEMLRPVKRSWWKL